MVWSTADYDNVTAYLGFPPVDYLTKVTTKMDALQTVSATAVTRVQGYITEIQSIEAQIETARNVPGSAFGQLKGEARRFTKLISLAIGLEVYEDIW